LPAEGRNPLRGVLQEGLFSLEKGERRVTWEEKKNYRFAISRKALANPGRALKRGGTIFYS